MPSANHAAGMAAVNTAIHDLTAQFTSEAISEAVFDPKLTSLCAERRRLHDLPSEPDQIQERATGVTIAEHWKTLDSAGKRRYLLAAGVQVHAARDDHGDLDAWLTGPPPNVVVVTLRGLSRGQMGKSGHSQMPM